MTCEEVGRISEPSINSIKLDQLDQQTMIPNKFDAVRIHLRVLFKDISIFAVMCHIIFITIAVLAVVLWHLFSSSEIQSLVTSPPEIYIGKIYSLEVQGY